MKTIYLLLASIISMGLTACSNDDVFTEENQLKNEQKKEMMEFEKSYNIWITTRAKMSKNNENKENTNKNDLIVDKAHQLLLAYGYDEEKLEKEVKSNKNIIISKAIQLYVSEKQTKF